MQQELVALLLSKTRNGFKKEVICYITQCNEFGTRKVQTFPPCGQSGTATGSLERFCSLHSTFSRRLD